MRPSNAASGAKPREWQRAPALDQQLDDVAGQDEHQADEYRQVGDREGVEDDLGEEVGREAGRARERRKPTNAATRTRMPASNSRGLSRIGTSRRTGAGAGCARIDEAARSGVAMLRE